MRNVTVIAAVVVVTTFASAARSEAPTTAEGGEEPADATPSAPRFVEIRAYEASPPAPVAPRPPKPMPPVGLRLDGGYARRTLFDIPIGGADVGLAVGAQPSAWGAYWGSVRLLLGSSENGLSVFSVRLGPDADLVWRRLRLGTGASLFVVGVGRAVRDETILSWGPAVHAAARFDVAQADGFALFVRGAIEGGYEVQGDSLFWGPTFGAGGDFDIAGTRPARAR